MEIDYLHILKTMYGASSKSEGIKLLHSFKAEASTSNGSKFEELADEIVTLEAILENC